MSLSAGQITLLRKQKQYSLLGLALLQPQTIFSCNVSDTALTNDMVTEVQYDTVLSGSYSDVLAGMTVFIGTTAGAHDLGYCRVRKAATASLLYVGETSDIPWNEYFYDGIYVTVVDAFEPWPKHLVVTTDEVYMDVDIAYDDQHTNFDPIPILGGQVVLDVSSYPASVSFPEVANSWVFDSSISAYSFSASEGSVTNGTTSNPTLTVNSYPTNGYIRVSLLVTAANGNTYTGYAYVFVFDSSHRPITDFELESCGCNRDDGGWTARVTLNDSTDIGTARFRGLAVLFGKDYFNGDEDTSVGLYSGRENVWMSGWVYEHNSVNDPSFEPRSFDIQGAAFWMSRMASFPVGVELATSTADAWTNMEGLTVDKGLYHFFHWRTTITSILDFYKSGDTRYSPAVESPAGNLWGQIGDIADVQISAKATCDHNGKLCVMIPYNLLPSADRAAASTNVMDLTTVDYERDVDLLSRAPQVAQVVLSGVAVDVYGNDSEIFSLSPGHTPALLGELLPVTNQLLADQDQANQFAGLIFANENNPYPEIPLTLTSINRAFDIAPVLVGTVAGLDEYSGTVIPVSIDYSYDHQTGKTGIDITFEGETDENDAIYVDGDIPDGSGGSISLSTLRKLPPLDPVDLPDIPTFPSTYPTTTSDCGSNYMNFFNLIWSKPYLDGSDSDLLVANATFSCKLRSNPLTPTYIDFSAKMVGDADEHFAVYAMLGGSKVVTARLARGIGAYEFRAYFDVESDTLVDGFQIELEYGGFSSDATITIASETSCTATQQSDSVITVQKNGSGNYNVGLTIASDVNLTFWLAPSLVMHACIYTSYSESANWIPVVSSIESQGEDGTWVRGGNCYPGGWSDFVFTNIGALVYAGAHTFTAGTKPVSLWMGYGTSRPIFASSTFSDIFYVVAGTIESGQRMIYLYGSVLNNVCSPS